MPALQRRGHRAGRNDERLGHEAAEQQGQDHRHRDRLDRLPPAAVGRLVLVVGRFLGVAGLVLDMFVVGQAFSLPERLSIAIQVLRWQVRNISERARAGYFDSLGDRNISELPVRCSEDCGTVDRSAEAASSLAAFSAASLDLSPPRRRSQLLSPQAFPAVPLADFAFQRCISPACGYTCGAEEVRTACPKCGDLLGRGLRLGQGPAAQVAAVFRGNVVPPQRAAAVQRHLSLSRAAAVRHARFGRHGRRRADAAAAEPTRSASSSA